MCCSEAAMRVRQLFNIRSRKATFSHSDYCCWTYFPSFYFAFILFFFIFSHHHHHWDDRQTAFERQQIIIWGSDGSISRIRSLNNALEIFFTEKYLEYSVTQIFWGFSFASQPRCCPIVFVQPPRKNFQMSRKIPVNCNCPHFMVQDWHPAPDLTFLIDFKASSTKTWKGLCQKLFVLGNLKTLRIRL